MGLIGWLGKSTLDESRVYDRPIHNFSRHKTSQKEWSLTYEVPSQPYLHALFSYCKKKKKKYFINSKKKTWNCDNVVSSELKLNLQKKVLFSLTDFLPWELLLTKKLEFKKLFFRFPTFVLIKIFRKVNLYIKKITYYIMQIWL